MARYLLIEFDDNAQADALRAQINAATLKGKKFRVVGLFAKPTKKVCLCIQARTDYKKNQLHRGSKFGWWVCKVCRRPRLGRHDLTNLLGVDDIVEPSLYQAMDILEVSPRPRTYQMVPGSLSLWPEVRHDIPAESAEVVVDAPHEGGQPVPYAR